MTNSKSEDCSHRIVNIGGKYICDICGEHVNPFGIAGKDSKPIIMEVLDERGEKVSEYVDDGKDELVPKKRRVKINEKRWVNDPAGVLNDLAVED